MEARDQRTTDLPHYYETCIKIKEKAEKENKVSSQNTHTVRQAISAESFFAIDPWFLKAEG